MTLPREDEERNEFATDVAWREILGIGIRHIAEEIALLGIIVDVNSGVVREDRCIDRGTGVGDAQVAGNKLRRGLSRRGGDGGDLRRGCGRRSGGGSSSPSGAGRG